MHSPVFKHSDALSFALQACTILYINGKQFRCSAGVFTFVQYIGYNMRFLQKVPLLGSDFFNRVNARVYFYKPPKCLPGLQFCNA